MCRTPVNRALSVLSLVLSLGSAVPANAAKSDGPSCGPRYGAHADHNAQPGTVGALKHGDTVYLYYQCRNCNQMTLGSTLHDGRMGCRRCGAPHTHEEYQIPSQGDLLKEEQLLKTQKDREVAESGKAWNCPYCTGSNLALHSHCRNCGAPRPAESAAGNATAKVTASITASAQKVKAESVAAKPISPGVKIGAAVGATGAVAAGVWAMQSEELPGKVASMQWQHTKTQERFTKVTRSEWKHRISESDPVMPVNGRGGVAGAFNIHGCQSRYYEDYRYVCGTETVQESYSRLVCSNCTNCRIVSNGNGTGTQTCDDKYETAYRDKVVDKYCIEPIYKPYCDYDTYEWKVVDTKSLSGSGPGDGALAWPELSLGQYDRAVPSEKYQVNFAYERKGEKETYTETPSSEAEFKSWKLGEDVIVVRRNLGTVKEIKRSSGN